MFLDKMNTILNKTTIQERIFWNKNSHVCQLWEKQNPLIRNGANVTISQGMKIEKELSAKCMKISGWSDYLAMNHAIAVFMVAITTLIFFPGFIKAGLIMLVTIVIAGISLRVSAKISLKKRTTMHNELMLHQNRTYRFIDYINKLAETLMMDDRHLFVFPGEHLSVLAETCLKGLAHQILFYEKCEDAFSKAVTKGYLNKAYDLFVLGGLIAPNTYEDYFPKQTEIDRGSGILITT